MDFKIVAPAQTPEEYHKIAKLLIRVYVEAGYTQPSGAEKLTAPEELRKRGDIILAKSLTQDILGMVICARPTSPVCQVAKPDEAEMHLLAVDPEARGRGIASALIGAFEQQSRSLGFANAVLSTQPTMTAAQRVYERLGYHRNPRRDWTKSKGNSYLVYEKTL